MANKMLIDATHPEETRVVVVDGSRVEEFDFESLNKRQLAGNIYLAKVTRVEPSLQAAFVDYGGNRHGFLAFSEIHPDYYQIPVADREALLAAEAEAEAAAEAEDDADAADGEREPRKPSGRKRRSRSRRRRSRKGSAVTATEAKTEDNAEAAPADAENSDATGENATDSVAEPSTDAAAAETTEVAQANESIKENDEQPAEAADAAEAIDAAPEEPVVVETEKTSVEAAAPEAVSTDDEDSGENAEEKSEGASDDSSEDDTNGSPRSIAEDAGTRDDATLVADAPADEDDEAESDDSDSAPSASKDSDTTVASEETAADQPAPSEEVDAADAVAADDDSAPVETADTASEGDETPAEAEETSELKAEDAPTSEASETGEPEKEEPTARGDEDSQDDEADGESEESPAEPIESVGANDVAEEVRPRRRPVRRYKIQEVIKRRQILLVQVVKEERGNKGAALTSYISIAGRYCVLMPNTARGGGISRKITNASDRKRLKDIASGLEVPKGMGLIVRTAGAERTKSEIKRDYDFLLRQWDLVRDMTLKSVAPTLIYEEGSLIKRSIRDLYSKEISSIQVEGEAGYREAKDYMKMLMPSHAKNVQPYRDQTPLFIRHQVESYLNSMFNPVVQLKSGGYIVIGVTEALVAIDVNSGRSTKESSIENTALRTNLEAAEEVARQLRLRDLAGLIVIDFIDMEESKNNRSVEKRFKEKLKNDRARLQVGRISGFGLLEMSRQRLRPGMLEATTSPCPHCHGQGIVRSEENLALSVLRQLEEEGVKRRSGGLKVTAPVPVANFIINRKRDNILQIESRYGLRVEVEGDPSRIGVDFSIERTNAPPPEGAAGPEAAVTAAPELMDVENEQDQASSDAPAAPAATEERPEGGKKRRRRRGRRGGRRKNETQNGAETKTETANGAPAEAKSEPSETSDEGRLTVTEDGPFGVSVEAASDKSVEIVPPLAAEAEAAASEEPAANVDDAPKEEVASEVVEAESEAVVEEPEADEAESVAEKAPVEPVEETAEASAEEEVEPAEPTPPRPKRTGWWSLGRG